MPYPYLGTTSRVYPQYFDAGTGKPLEVEPGGTYSMYQAPGRHVMPIPPGDGQWGPDVAAAGGGDAGQEQDAAGDAAPAKASKTSKGAAAQAAEQGA